jgi:hypothetical protein
LVKAWENGELSSSEVIHEMFRTYVEREQIVSEPAGAALMQAPMWFGWEAGVDVGKMTAIEREYLV